jgi:hypothetical protein
VTGLAAFLAQNRVPGPGGQQPVPDQLLGSPVQLRHHVGRAGLDLHDSGLAVPREQQVSRLTRD